MLLPNPPAAPPVAARGPPAAASLHIASRQAPSRAWLRRLSNAPIGVSEAVRACTCGADPHAARCTLHWTASQRAVAASQVKDRLRTILLENIERERRGEIIDRVLLKSTLSMLMHLGIKSREVYEQDFERHFLQQVGARARAVGRRVRGSPSWPPRR